VIAIGVDIGGTAVKAGLVDTATGELIGDRRRVSTPPRGGPDDMAVVVAGLLAELPTDAPVGIGFPGPVVHGRIMAATHLDDAWIGCDAPRFFGSVLGRRCAVLNDADAAGCAEMRFGAGLGETDVALMLTLGTGIGSALFVNGRLVPNLEFGHIEIDGRDGEIRAAARVRELEHLSWQEWATRLETFLRRVDRLVWPDVIILGGEVTVEAARFLELLDVRPRIAIAKLENAAGVVGAAMAVASCLTSPAGRA
jgi:polyphosphate glucokinase